MERSEGNLEKIEEQIVCTSLVYDIEYQSVKNDTKKRKQLYDAKLEAVDENIKMLCSSIQQRLPSDVSLPSNIQIEVAKQMLTEVQNNHTLVDAGFSLDEQQFMKVLNLPIRDDETIEKNKYTYKEMTETILYSSKSLEDRKEEFIRTGIFKLSNGSTIQYVDIKDSIFSCSKEAAAEDMEILNHVNDLDMIFKSFEKNPENVEKSLDLTRRVVGLNNGRDAALKFINMKMRIEGIEFLTKNPLGKAFFADMVKTLKQDRETGTGIRDDNFTIFSKMDMFTEIKKLCKSNGVDQETIQFFESQMKEIDPKLYDFLEKNPGFYECIKKEFFDENDINTNDEQELAIKFAGTSKAIDVNTTFNKFEEFVKEHEECQKEPTGNVPQPKSQEVVIEEPKPKNRELPIAKEKTTREMIDLNKNLLLRIYKKNGIEGALAAAFKNSTAEKLASNVKTAWLEATVELLDPEKFGTEGSILQNNDDLESLKNQLKTVCSNANASQYAQRVGKAVKEISDKDSLQIFSAGTIESIVEQFSDDNSKFEGPENLNAEDMKFTELDERDF